VRIGIGYDVHRLVADRKLILGGVDIPHYRGLLGHSDADVVVHAIMDALLGAAGSADIGKHFPDSDERYKGISSLRLLQSVRKHLADKGYMVNNIDAVIVAQKPKLSPYLDLMAINIAETLETDRERVNIKATTTEGLGFAGMEEGIAAHAVAMIVHK